MYKIVRKNDANLFLEYIEEENYYVVTCNKSISEQDIKQYVQNNYEWLMNWYKNLDNPQPWFIFGQQVPVSVKLDGCFSIDYDGNQITVHLRHKRDYLAAVKHFYKEFSAKYLSQRLNELLIQYGLQANFGKTSWATYYYGKCFASKKIDFSAKLVQYSKDFIDSVILHEMAHLTHMNHHKEFWNLLTNYCPNHKQLDKEAFQFKMHNHIW